jgi:signal transduction histidine kinase
MRYLVGPSLLPALLSLMPLLEELPRSVQRGARHLPALSERMFTVDIHSPKGRFKLGVLLALLLLALGSFYYTDNLIGRLRAHEEEEIRLYVKGLQYMLTTEDPIIRNFFLDEVVKTNRNIPVVVTDQAGEIETWLNVPGVDSAAPYARNRAVVQAFFASMRDDNPPFEFDNGFGTKQYVYYSNSFLLTQLQYYPLVQMAGLLVFGFLAYLAISSDRRAEQNRVWVGLAKETAHQLGTPLSSLTAWIEYFKGDPERYEPEIVQELEKDVRRLDTITTRFSNIGSVPTLRPESIAEAVTQFMDYLQKRISTKVRVSIKNQLEPGRQVPINRYLFEWVVENLCKNAVDAMEGTGELHILLHELKDRQIAIDITDTGKGISKANLSKVFTPGFSTKRRGWGLGLTLAKRIVENYHQGKLFVKNSEVGKGTTFRIILPGAEGVNS